MKKIVSQIFLIGAFLAGSVSSVFAATCPAGQICNPLRYGNLEGLIDAIISFLITVGIPIATIMFVIAGIVFVTSAGDPRKAKTAKDIMIYTSVGLAVILLASGLSKVLQSLLGGE
ncbi:MAG: pilin [Patescibacteria group bacterium]